MSYAIIESGKVVKSSLSESALPSTIGINQKVSYQGHIRHTTISLNEIGPGANLIYKKASARIERCADPDNAFYVEAHSENVSDLVELIHRVEKKLGFKQISLEDNG